MLRQFRMLFFGFAIVATALTAFGADDFYEQQLRAGKADLQQANSDWKRVVDEVAPFRPYVCLTGGEPTMVPHLPELIAHVKRHGLVCALTTMRSSEGRADP